jgi:hypothetical protein
MDQDRPIRFVSTSVVIAGLDPAIHSVTVAMVVSVTEWMPGSSPGMTTVEVSTSRLVAECSTFK